MRLWCGLAMTDSQIKQGSSSLFLPGRWHWHCRSFEEIGLVVRTDLARLKYNPRQKQRIGDRSHTVDGLQCLSIIAKTR